MRLARGQQVQGQPRHAGAAPRQTPRLRRVVTVCLLLPSHSALPHTRHPVNLPRARKAASRMAGGEASSRLPVVSNPALSEVTARGAAPVSSALAPQTPARRWIGPPPSWVWLMAVSRRAPSTTTLVDVAAFVMSLLPGL